jgi:hypothetical protein
MTNQSDPNRDQRRPADYVRRPDGSWSMMPILLGLALVLGLGYLFMGMDWNRSTTPVTGDTTTRQTTPQTTPTPTAPKQ